ncbi:MAG: hypothetical protein OEN56_00065 [Gemmatimonadota bacterium]|nr:hypothetical protein [Gemmatimonadota bacterium]
MHGTTRIGSLVLLLALLGGCGASELLGPDALQGIEGIALRGPLCPVQSLENPCPDEPHQARVLIRTSGGQRVTEFSTGEDGRFKVGLKPGSYTLVPEPGDPFPIAQDLDVEVVAGVYTEVTLLFDTGIR